jgi:hypothetical protein
MEDSIETPEKKKTKLKIELPYDSAIPLLGIYPKKCKSGHKEDLHTHFYCSIHKRQAMETAQISYS